MAQKTEPKTAMSRGAFRKRAPEDTILLDDLNRSRGGRPTKKETQELDQRIIDTAAVVFAQHGFAATSMEQVASTCHAGKDTIYRRYPSKAALFSAIVENLRGKVLLEIDSFAQDQGSSIERLHRFAMMLLTINLRPNLVALNRVALSEAIPSGAVKPMPTTEDPLMSRFASIVKEAQADGFLKDGDPLMIAEQLLYATSMKPLVSAMLGEDRFSDIVERQRYFNSAWEMFMGGLRA